MDLIYSLYDWYIYDNFLNREDTLVLSTDMCEYKSFTGNNVYRSPKDFKRDLILEVNTSDIFSYNLMSKTHLPNYNAYNMLWNETKTGIDLSKYNSLILLKSMHSFDLNMICKNNRVQSLLDLKLNIIL